jgi:hypothetical protein
LKVAGRLTRTFPQVEDCKDSGQGRTTEDVLRYVWRTPAGWTNVVCRGTNSFLKSFRFSQYVDPSQPSITGLKRLESVISDGSMSGGVLLRSLLIRLRLLGKEGKEEKGEEKQKRKNEITLGGGL